MDVGFFRRCARGSGSGTEELDPSSAEVRIAGYSFPTGRLVEQFRHVPIYLGWVAPEPQFDTTPLGPESPIDTNGPVAVFDPDVLDGPTIFVGKIDGLFSVFMNAQGGSERIPCLWIGATAQTCDTPGAFFHWRDGGPHEPYATWFDLPEGTSVVAVLSDNGPLGWQRPVGGVALIPIPELGHYELTAFDPTGLEIGGVSVVLTAIIDSDQENAPSTTTTTMA